MTLWKRIAIDAFLIFTCHIAAQSTLPSEDSTSDIPQNSVLIAAPDKGFKKMLAEKIEHLLKNDWNQVERILLDDIKKTEVEKYDAVIIIHGIQMTRIPSSVSGYLKRIKNATGKTTLVTTVASERSPKMGNFKWKPKVNVDAITCASVKSNIDSIAGQIVSHVEQKINNQK